MTLDLTPEQHNLLVNLVNVAVKAVGLELVTTEMLTLKAALAAPLQPKPEPEILPPE